MGGRNDTSFGRTKKTIHKGMSTRVCGNIQTASIRYNPLAPKFNVIWRALAPMEEENEKINPLTSLLVTRALKHWDLGARGFNIVRVAGFESVVHLVSRSLMFSHLVIFKLFCGNITLHAADHKPSCAKHWFVEVNASCRPIFSFR